MNLLTVRALWLTPLAAMLSPFAAEGGSAARPPRILLRLGSEVQNPTKCVLSSESRDDRHRLAFTTPRSPSIPSALILSRL
jgi:hypothetical protein